MSKTKSQISPSRRGQHESATLEASLLPANSRLKTRPIWGVRASRPDKDIAKLSREHRAWLDAVGWKAEAGSVVVLPGGRSEPEGAVLGISDASDPRAPLIAGVLPSALPPGAYHFVGAFGEPHLAALAWVLGGYTFSRYRKGNGAKARQLKLPEGVRADEVLAIARAVKLGRDLINTPANDLAPSDLAETVRKLARAHGAKVTVTAGDALLKKNFPMIHAVGRASDRAPCLVDLVWGQAKHPKVTLIGKGICFDTGGLDIKPAQAMLLMKKDMGGAASAIVLAAMIMQAKLPVRLRLLIPAADNSISGSAFRPGDVLQSRGGLTVEIGNTDAEGRLVLADALALADEEAPDHLITFATLTGAARVALGPDLPPLYSTDDRLAEDLLASGLRVGDPLWRMPFWMPYDAGLKSKIADLNNVSDGPFAGSIVAAMFLKRFVKQAKRYLHLDIYGWVPRAQPARPEGGDPQGARALFDYLRGRFA